MARLIVIISVSPSIWWFFFFKSQVKVAFSWHVRRGNCGYIIREWPIFAVMQSQLTSCTLHSKAALCFDQLSKQIPHLQDKFKQIPHLQDQWKNPTPARPTWGWDLSTETHHGCCSCSHGPTARRTGLPDRGAPFLRAGYTFDNIRWDEQTPSWCLLADPFLMSLVS